MAATLLAGMTGMDPDWFRDRLTDIEIPAIQALVGLIPQNVRAVVGWVLLAALLAAMVGVVLFYTYDERLAQKQHAQTRSAAPVQRPNLHAIGGTKNGQRAESMGSRHR